jgi:hypothetical protein
MSSTIKILVATFALLLSAFVSTTAAAAATAPPKVVFIGDLLTYGWPITNPNWVNQGAPGIALDSTSANVLARFQADVVSLHPQVVHIMVGSGDAQLGDDANWSIVTSSFLTNIQSMVAEAKAANIQVIFGLEPQFTTDNPIEPFNSILVNYAAQNGIPVINYDSMLCQCVGSVSSYGGPLQNGGGYPPAVSPDSVYLVQQGVESTPITPAGYTVMTQMVTATLASMGATLRGGYLQNLEGANEYTQQSGTQTANVNSVLTGSVIQFTPYAYYSNGQTVPLTNSNFAGATGTWVSSNPLVMSVNQQGLAYALSAGTAAIMYTSPGGVKFSEWVMYVYQGGE